MLFTVLALAVCAYLLICLLLYVFQERLIFFPEVTAPDWTYTFSARFEEVTWQVEGASLHALHFKVDHPKGAILYLHGNAGSLRSWGDVVADFTRRGYDVLIPDYRGYGKSTGKISGEQMLHEDALRAYGYLEQRYPRDRIVVYGRSIGTGIAARLATTTTPRLLILETPYVSLQEIAHRQFPFVPSFLLKYSLRTDRWIAAVRCPIYLFHGTRDEFIPYDSSVRLSRLIAAPHELVSIPGGGHNNLAGFDQYQHALDRILK